MLHEAKEGGLCAEVPALPGCASHGETMDALLATMREAIGRTRREGAFEYGSLPETRAVT